ncbi:MAG: FAD binding domain-containing protein [Actinobacteria bacterium]|nr:FAD binding domain-containing protein [Actinomycetota bacterium]
MTVVRPRSLSEAIDALSDAPDADLLAGGTDFMVEVNFGHRRPQRIIALRRVEELQGWRRDNGVFDFGALVTYRQIEHELADELPAFAGASRTVGSPQIRNAGTVGGNVGTASPAGDALPLLTALDAQVVCDGVDGRRTLPLLEFITGPKQTARREGELIVRIRFDRCSGPQHFLKIGPRNAMAISTACLALVADTDARRVRVGSGSAGPRPMRPDEAEAFASEAVDWDTGDIASDDLDTFAEMVAGATAPISDHRGTAEYRSYAIGVLARRALRRAVADLAGATS